MNCYYSPQQTAIGICKSCGKGLSMDYATELENGLACKNQCEQRVIMINQILDINSKVLSVSNTQLRRNTIFMIISGLLFIALGFFIGRYSFDAPAIIFALLGTVFILRGIFGYSKSARYPTQKINTEQGA